MSSIVDMVKAYYEARARRNPYTAVAGIYGLSEDVFEREARRVVEEELLRFDSKVDFSSMTLLNIGCGMGRMEMYLANKFKSVVGLDVSPTMIDLARKRLAGKRNVHFHLSTGSDLRSIPDETADFVMCHGVFDVLPSNVVFAYFQDTYRVLNPGGFFKFLIPVKDRLAALVAIKVFTGNIASLRRGNLQQALQTAKVILLRTLMGDASVVTVPEGTTFGRVYSRKELQRALTTIGFEHVSYSYARTSRDSIWVTCRKPSSP